jgi:hypothetical protein
MNPNTKFKVAETAAGLDNKREGKIVGLNAQSQHLFVQKNGMMVM